ncbi:MAG: hypothetical protein Edafosvirus25_11 [Edafosvirus sp.]|uniref:Uncharacterized protein n=1 Tax=Edafosvirus sp. TaxID=2487765 RepID=A0A3G4ZUW3_9VIRU|nr:MAG: hypothetical protein Edafosvirus25_11 [Edafosvirus sp.]
MSRVIRKLNNAMCNDNIMLEPRLQEYLKKKELYKKNNINPCIPVEKEYMITKDDEYKIKLFINGDKSIYQSKNNILNADLKHQKQYFPSKQFRKDERMKRIKRKKEKMEKPINRGMFAVDDSDELFYEDPVRIEENKIMHSRDFHEGTEMGKEVGQQVNMQLEANLNDKYKLNHPTSNRLYNYVPKIDYNQRLYNEPLEPLRQCYTIDNPINNTNKIIGELDTYSSLLTPSYNESSEMDMNTKIVIPKMNSNNKKCLDISNYQPVPYMGYGRGAPETPIETEIMLGTPSKTSKTYGYQNPFEHYFDYVSEDVQDHHHIVPQNYPRGGVPSRLDNRKEPAKYYRDVM